MSFRRRSGTEVNTPRAMTSRSIFENQISTWLSPRRVRWRELKSQIRVIAEELFDAFALLSRKVVQDHMDLFPVWLGSDDRGEERHELLARVAGDGLAENFARPGIKSGAERSVPVVLETMPFESARHLATTLMPPPSHRAVLFDWNGTVADTKASFIP